MGGSSMNLGELSKQAELLIPEGGNIKVCKQMLYCIMYGPLLAGVRQQLFHSNLTPVLGIGFGSGTPPGKLRSLV